MRASSSASVTGEAPGRVDSPPTSIMSQPAPAISAACASAASAATKRPPSENESGVRLRMPMTIGRVPIFSRNASRWARCAARIGLVSRVRKFTVKSFDAPIRVLTDPLREIGLCALHALAQRTVPHILDSLLLALIGVRQRANREHNRYQVHGFSPWQSIRRILRNSHAILCNSHATVHAKI